MSVHNIQESNALLLYKVGPVYVCSPTMPVEAVTVPPKLTVPPGSSVAEPGVFKSIHGMVRLVDLRVRFGVEKADMKDPGKIVIVEVEGGHAGFWVDEIEDVISFPTKGWSQVPAYIPRNVFSRTLIEKNNIRLYADFEQLDKLKSTGYLRKHIEMIKVAASKQEENKKPSSSLISETEKQINKEKTTAIHITADKMAAEEHSKISDVKGNNKASDQVMPLDGSETDKRDISATQAVGAEVNKADNNSEKVDENAVKNPHINNLDKDKWPSDKESNYLPTDRLVESKPKTKNKYTSNMSAGREATEESSRKNNIKNTNKTPAHAALSGEPVINKRDISAALTERAEKEKVDSTSTNIDKNRFQSKHTKDLDKTKQLNEKEINYHSADRAVERKSVINNKYINKSEDNSLYESRKPASKIKQGVSIDSVRSVKSNNNNNERNPVRSIIKNNSAVEKTEEIRTNENKFDEIKESQQENNGVVWISLLALMVVVGVYFLFDSMESGDDKVLKVDKKRVITKTFKYTESRNSTERRNYAEVKDPVVTEKEIVTIDPISENNDSESESASRVTIVENETVEITKNNDGLLIVVNEVVQEDELIESDVEENDYNINININELKNADIEDDVNDEISKKESGVAVEDKIEVLRDSQEITTEKINIEKTDELGVSDKTVSLEDKNEIKGQEEIEDQKVKEGQLVIESRETVDYQKETDSKGAVENKKVKESEPVKAIKVDESVAQVVLNDSKAVAEKPKKVALKNTKEVTEKSSKKYVHVVVKGDTLWFIAKRYVHNPWRYPELAKLSNIKNPDLIYPGDHVTIIINYKRANK